MDGMHDLGGRQGFGACATRSTRTAFHARVGECARTRSMRSRCGTASSTWTSTATRSSAWSRATTSAASYYERSLTGLATLCVEKGVVTREELERRAEGAFPLAAPSAPGRTNAPARERFAPGDRVRVQARLRARPHPHAGYIRGKIGVVVSESPAYPSPMRMRTASRRTTSRPTTCASQRGPVAQLCRPGARSRWRVPELSRARRVRTLHGR